MKLLSPQSRLSLKELLDRVDRAAASLNVLLVIIALGLAMLDTTFFVTEKIIDNLPPITHVGDSGQSSQPN
jgi:hypothetical protein